MNRAEILATATQYVTKDRAETHGDAVTNHELIARYWGIHLGHPVTASDVLVMMALLKIARIKGTAGNADHWVDGCGYLALGGEISTSPERAE